MTQQHWFVEAARVDHPARRLTLADHWKRTLRTRWILLANHKQNPQPFGIRQFSHIVTYPLNLARRLKAVVMGLSTDAYPRHRVFEILFAAALTPIMVPYFICWEWRFRKARHVQ